MGGSHGGWVSALMATRDPDIDAAVCFNGVFDKVNTVDNYPRALHLCTATRSLAWATMTD